MLLLKNPQFLPNDYKTHSKLSTHEYLILTDFHNHWVKIVDLKKRHLYYESLDWGGQVCIKLKTLIEIRKKIRSTPFVKDVTAHYHMGLGGFVRYFHKFEHFLRFSRFMINFY